MQKEVSGYFFPRHHSPVTRSSWNGDARNMEAIGITRRSSILRAGCVPPCSSISTRLHESCMVARRQSHERRLYESSKETRLYRLANSVVHCLCHDLAMVCGRCLVSLLG